jgi:transcriptional regulator with XRE-family HTH domain
LRRTKNFADVVRSKLSQNPDLAEAVKGESFNADIAQKVYDLRTEAQITQKQLAEMVGTQQSVISRIEDADYDGHSLNLLCRIADALGTNLRVEFYARRVVQQSPVVETEFAVNWDSAETDSWQPAISNYQDADLAAD